MSSEDLQLQVLACFLSEPGSYMFDSATSTRTVSNIISNVSLWLWEAELWRIITYLLQVLTDLQLSLFAELMIVWNVKMATQKIFKLSFLFYKQGFLPFEIGEICCESAIEAFEHLRGYCDRCGVTWTWILIACIVPIPAPRSQDIPLALHIGDVRTLEVWELYRKLPSSKISIRLK